MGLGRGRWLIGTLALVFLAPACASGTNVQPAIDAAIQEAAATALAGTATVGATRTLAPTVDVPTPSARGPACGLERWPVKTLSDLDAAKVDFHPKPTDVTSLRALVAPASLPQDRRIAPTELETYAIEVEVQGFKLEDDSDIHVVVHPIGKPGETMIVELAEATCNGAVASAQREAMQSARQSFTSVCGGPSKKFRPCAATLEITGVAFFDFLHGQTGVAPNGIELHPVLSVTRLGAGVPAVIPSPPTQAPPMGLVASSAASVSPTIASSTGNLSVTALSVTSPASRGSTATLTAQTTAGASCSITVRYKSGPSSAAGLGSKTAAANGQVSWSWRVGANTTPGTWPITLTCSLGSAQATASTSFQVN